jgi:SAM-dependent methyltransferase
LAVSPPCLYCGGEAFTAFYRDIRDRLGYVPGAWAFLRCAACGSALLQPFPDEGDLPAFYPPVYGFAPELEQSSPLRRVLGRLQHALLYRPTYTAQARLVASGIAWDGRKGLRVLDVGCGKGLRLQVFRGWGFETRGMDFQPADVDYVTRHLGIPAVCTDFRGLADHYPGGSFDLVTAFCVLEHVPDALQMVGSCARLLRPGGWFVAAVPLADSAQARWLGARWMQVTEAPRHLSLPSRAGLLALASRARLVNARVRPDSLWTCAAQVGLSLFPGAATTHVYGRRDRLGSLFSRALAGAVSVLAVPWCVAENYWFRRPACGLLFAQRPEEARP